MTLSYETKSKLEVAHTYTKHYAQSVSLEQSITGPQSERKKCSPHIPNLILQNTFQYYPSIKGYDFQKGFQSNFYSYMELKT
jgi:hypothetical protein